MTDQPTIRYEADLDPEVTYDIDDRDPDYIRDTMALMWILASVWHRAEVRGLDRIPEGGSLVVGNHSGGITPPDAPIFATAFCSYFGVERPVFLLSHDTVMKYPGSGFMRKWGMMPASRANVSMALSRGATVVVFPGGDYDVSRPTSQRNVIDFGGRKGFIRTALEHEVPIVPLVSVGAQESQWFISRGERLARFMQLDKVLRAKIMPVSFGFPFGISLGGFPPNIPLPSKITTEVLDPIDPASFGKRPDIDQIYRHVTETMQRALDELAAERKYPILG